MNVDDLIGKTEEEAKKLCKESNFTSRIRSRDGISFNVTMDARSNRVNLEIANNLVVNAYIG